MAAATGGTVRGCGIAIVEGGDRGLGVDGIRGRAVSSVAEGFGLFSRTEVSWVFSVGEWQSFAQSLPERQ